MPLKIYTVAKVDASEAKPGDQLKVTLKNGMLVTLTLTDEGDIFTVSKTREQSDPAIIETIHEMILKEQGEVEGTYAWQRPRRTLRNLFPKFTFIQQPPPTYTREEISAYSHFRVACEDLEIGCGLEAMITVSEDANDIDRAWFGPYTLGDGSPIASIVPVA